jgi:CO/xanthine dehydrogenase Mo-binding subunit
MGSLSHDIVFGRLRYAADVDLPGMLHARILRSPYPHALVKRVDATAAPAEVVSLTPDDVRELGAYGCQIQDETVLALERARHVGDPVAAVAAPTPREAEEALALVEVEYEELDAVFDPVAAARPGATLVHERHRVSANPAAYFGLRPEDGTNICHRFRLESGDVEAGFAAADVVVEETYRTASAQHVAMEPHAALARWEGDRLEVWTGTQTPFNVRADLAAVFGIPEEHIRVVSPPMGGAFGAKAFVRLEAIVAALARKAGAPVRAVLTRPEEWLTLNRHPSVIRIAAGARADGELVAKRVEAWIDTGAYADCGPGVAQKIGYTVVGPYRIPNVRVDSRCVYTNLPPNGAFRGYGATQAVWASERLMDTLAERLDIDPLELRLRNVLRDGDGFATGEIVHDVRFVECLEAAAAAIGWRESRRGKGLCVLLKGMQTPSRAEIAIEAEDDGYVLRCATAEMGQGARTAICTMAAELLEVDRERIRFPDPDTDVVPYDTRTTSSRSTHMMGRALEEAVQDLRATGGARGFGRVVNEGGIEPDTGQGIASTHWHQGAAAAEVAVDEETGKVDVLRLHAAIYAGRVVNRPGAELQNEGSMIMGLGTALYESVDFADGQVTNANLGDYMVPSAADLPELTHELVEREGAEVHGLGETALPPVPAAIGNALASLGAQLVELPMTAEAVLAALDARGHPEPPPGSSITGNSARVGDETVTKA